MPLSRKENKPKSLKIRVSKHVKVVHVVHFFKKIRHRLNGHEQAIEKFVKVRRNHVHRWSDVFDKQRIVSLDPNRIDLYLTCPVALMSLANGFCDIYAAKSKSEIAIAFHFWTHLFIGLKNEN